jgi:lauroyl/myristoyl acyltransferase
VLAGLIAALAAASLALPARRWPEFAARLARLRAAKRGLLTADERAMIAVVAGERPAGWADEVFWPSMLAHKYLSWMQILACHTRRTWRPGTRLIGREHVDLALEGGRGVVLFTATFAYKDLMAKAALADAGYALSHVSRDTHGFSGTRFGKRWLNPIYTSVEQRFLHERLVFSGSNTKEVSAAVRDRLQRNRPVMITVTPLGRQVATRPFLGGQIHIATGGLSFACEQDTPVLPVFSLRQADGEVTTFVGSALQQPQGASLGARIDALLDDYVPRLESHVRRHPDQFSFPLTERSGVLLLSPARPRPSVPAGIATDLTAA